MFLQPQKLFLFIVVASAWFPVGCVSVKLETKTAKRNNHVKYDSPAKPFEKIRNDQVDVAWKNTRTGGIISFVSECGGATDQSLETLRSEVLQGLSEEKILNETTQSYLAREALRSSLSGSVDGVASSIELLIFKKDGCSYILTLVSTPKTIATDKPSFEKFLAGFEAP